MLRADGESHLGLLVVSTPRSSHLHKVMKNTKKKGIPETLLLSVYRHFTEVRFQTHSLFHREIPSTSLVKAVHDGGKGNPKRSMTAAQQFTWRVLGQFPTLRTVSIF